MVPVSKRTIIRVCKEETYIFIEIDDAQITKKQWFKEIFTYYFDKKLLLTIYIKHIY